LITFYFVYFCNFTRLIRQLLHYTYIFNLLLALDGWTSANSLSIYNFIVLTPSNQQYLYCLRDFSSFHHTGEFLASEIEKVLLKIGVDNVGAIVTDNAANVRVAREIITKKHPHILNLRCIAHFINLITKSILGIFILINIFIYLFYKFN